MFIAQRGWIPQKDNKLFRVLDEGTCEWKFLYHSEEGIGEGDGRLMTGIFKMW